MKYRCLYYQASTNSETGKGELPQNCVARRCRGEFDRIKDLLVCYTAESGNPIGVMRWRKDRERALFRRGIAMAIYVDSETSTIKMGKRMLRGVCEVPDAIPVVTTREEANNLIRSYKPDIVIIDWYERNGPDERIPLLEDIKGLDPKIKVVLHSDYFKKEECERLGVCFDGVINKGWDENSKLKDVVSKLAKEILAPKQ